MTNPTDPLAAAVAARRLSPADIEANIDGEVYFTAQNGVDGASAVLELHSRHPGGQHLGHLRLLTFCVLTLRNGTKVVGINHGAIDPAQHSAERGRDESRKDALNKVWELMGYELRSKLAAQPTDYRARVRSEAAELDAKITKLCAFLGSEAGLALPQEQQDLLSAQKAAMLDYSGCLAERIATFN